MLYKFVTEMQKGDEPDSENVMKNEPLYPETDKLKQV